MDQDIYQENIEKYAYVVEIKIPKWFSLAIGCIALGASFSLASKMVQFVIILIVIIHENNNNWYDYYLVNLIKAGFSFE